MCDPGLGRVFAEVTVEEVLEGFKIRQCAISCGFILSLTDTFFDHGLQQICRRLLHKKESQCPGHSS